MVHWIKSGPKRRPILRLKPGYIELNNEACELLGTKFVDVGIDDGVLIIMPGKTYTVSTYKTGYNKLRGRIGGTGLTRSLMDSGVFVGEYLFFYEEKRNRFEAYLYEQTHTVIRKKRGRKAKTE